MKLYIIHVERTNGELWHYIGVTTLPQTSDRLKKHLEPSNMGNVKNYVNYASRVTMFELQKQVSIPMEKALQALDEQSVRDYVCPICSEGKTLLDGDHGFRFFTESAVEVAAIDRTGS